MIKILIYLFIAFNYKILNASVEMNCVTTKQSGLNFIGKDYLEILKYLELDKFLINISRDRDEIISDQKNEQKKNGELRALKNVHFLELLIIKSNGYPVVFHCSWRHKLLINKIEENNFECIEQTKKRDLFSIDYLGNFSYSSTFEFFKKKKKSKTLHSLFGKCKRTIE